MIRIFLVDDQSLVRAGLKLVIDSQRDMEVVGEAGDGRAALDALAVTTVDVVEAIPPDRQIPTKA